MNNPIPDVAAWCDRLSVISTPVLTWYGKERIELSGPVLARWLAKTDNFLTEEFPFGGESFHLDLPLSWRHIIWESVCLLRGWQNVSAGEADLLVGTDMQVLTEAAARGQTAVAQTLDPLALAWPGDLPPGVLDGNADVYGQADTVPSAGRAVQSWTTDTSLLVESGNTSGWTRGVRVRLRTEDPRRLTAQALQLWWGGAAILVAPGAGEERLRQIMEQEKVNTTLD